SWLKYQYGSISLSLGSPPSFGMPSTCATTTGTGRSGVFSVTHKEPLQENNDKPSGHFFASRCSDLIARFWSSVSSIISATLLRLRDRLPAKRTTLLIATARFPLVAAFVDGNCSWRPVLWIA